MSTEVGKESEKSEKRLTQDSDGRVTAAQEDIDGAVCTPGETMCINRILHKCNSSGRWFATGQSC